jgi:hypothetical protein
MRTGAPAVIPRCDIRPGIGPGRYRCVWVLRVARDCNVPQLNFKISVVGARRLGSGLAPSTEVDPVGQAGAATDSAACITGSGAGPTKFTVLDSLVVTRQELLSHAGPHWYGQHAGQFEVPAGMAYDVEIKLWDHSGNWKSGMMFRELVLKRADEPDSEEPTEGPMEEAELNTAEQELGLDDAWDMVFHQPRLGRVRRSGLRRGP